MSVNNPERQNQDPTLALQIGNDIVADQLPNEQELGLLVDHVNMLSDRTVDKNGDIGWEEGLLAKAQHVVEDHQVAISGLQQDIQGIKEEQASIRGNIIETTRVAGDDEHLRNALAILSSEQGSFDKQKISRRVRQYMAAKLFERGHLDMAITVLTESEKPTDKIVSHAGELITFMFADTPEQKKGLSQPYAYFEVAGARLHIRAGRIENFGLIGSIDSANSELAKRDRQSLSPDIPLNSCILVSANVDDVETPYFILTTDEVTFDPVAAENKINALIFSNTVDDPQILVGNRSIQSAINQLHKVSSDKSIGQPARNKALYALKEFALQLAANGVDMVDNPELALPNEHINICIRAYTKKCVESISKTILENSKINVANYLDEGKRLQISKKSRMSILTATHTSEQLDINTLIDQAVEYVAGIGFREIYLNSNDSRGRKTIVSAIIGGVEQHIRANSRSTSEKDSRRLEEICKFLNTELRGMVDRGSVPQDKTADNQQDIQDQEVKPGE